MDRPMELIQFYWRKTKATEGILKGGEDTLTTQPPWQSCEFGCNSNLHFWILFFPFLDKSVRNPLNILKKQKTTMISCILFLLESRTRQYQNRGMYLPSKVSEFIAPKEACKSGQWWFWLDFPKFLRHLFEWNKITKELSDAIFSPWSHKLQQYQRRLYHHQCWHQKHS